jgi:hypothetical protein
MSQYQFSSSELSKYRQITDPLAERVVEELFNHYPLKKVDKLFRMLPEHIENKSFPDFLSTYINELQNLPSFIEPERIARAQNFFWRYGRDIMLSLLFRSLPMCYVCANGAEVLATTARLIDNNKDPNYTRRLLETLQFVINICSDSEAFAKDSLALTTVKRIRLIHATIRRYIHENKDWPTQKLGAPINQEDQLITISAFSIEVLHALEKMGIYASDQEKEDWCHLWICTGYLMGIEPKLLPQSYAQFCTMSKNILVTQARESVAGKELVQSCVEFMGTLLPFKILYGLSYASIKYINDTEYRTIMGLTKQHWFWDWAIPKVMKSTLGVDQRLQKKSKVWSYVLSKLNHWLLNGLEKTMMKNGQYFYLPKSLKA